MKKKFLDWSINFLKKQNSYSEQEIKKLRYGLEGIYLTFTKIIIILLSSIIFGIFKEVIILLLLFNIIRYFSFGFHAEKSYECLIVSLFNFILVPFFLLNIEQSLITNLIIYIITFICFLLFAPADTPKRPLKSKRKRIIRKILTIIIALIYIVLSMIFRDYYISDILICSLITAAILVTPVTYMIFNQSYNNYKNN